MNITIFSIGTQGDVRPFIALGLGLQAKGHKVCIASGKTCETLVKSQGLSYAPLTADFLEVMAKDPRAIQRGLNPLALMTTARRHLKDMSQHWATEGLAAAEGADLLLGNGMMAVLANSLGEALNIPAVETHLQPVTPCPDIPPMMLTPPEKPRNGFINEMLYHLLRAVTWRMLSAAYSPVRSELKLSTLPWYGPYYRQKKQDRRILYGYSPALLPPSLTWPIGVQVCGNWYLEGESQWCPSDELVQFLANGEKPIYIGFGSMLSDDTDNLSAIIYDALALSGRRAIIATGWGGLTSQANNNPNVLVIDAAPHDWLFPRVALAVHHGGAGTTAATIKAGIPSVVVPFFGDQPFWAWRLQKNGVAPKMLKRAELTAPQLAKAIEDASQESMRINADKLAQKVAEENGVDTAISLLEQWGLLKHDSPSTAAA
ncbi:O-mycaminosyltylonolide 6-deoxyallosyltransferase [Zhongshania aliphaticivorans]|uniref:O-mycaminosyltylonolide 6-deoxyallosyltransferase n=1 Tax=Zhongshania aliphaticivorans TaxID=1470434 RepID=A0A5S9NJ84_9GAMM|nr:glycosyltransferase [Zhongshania aliphaticivorans]CAA0088883.1 O-mycaminosyltylonolide 6-deoxyallosyltransferase [Zhongshania aliphaticivorans]CAA0095331.1 O-mycaminosyltylonolide 6-deoxyallosyltransferase [Zhongshania aliphaticivorans]